MELQEVLDLARDCGFSHWGGMNMEKLAFLPEVRDMCAAGSCGQYGRCWSCPPACGSLEEISRKAGGYPMGVLVQSTGQMEDDFDVDTMMETERLHKQRFLDFTRQMRAREPGCLPMAAGSCTVCERCAYPEPCRFPEQMIPSMEAYGIFVSQLCSDSGLGYYYGPKTITYTSCVLFGASAPSPREL